MSQGKTAPEYVLEERLRIAERHLQQMDEHLLDLLRRRVPTMKEVAEYRAALETLKGI